MVLPVLINWSMNIYGWQGALVAFGVLCLSSSIFGALMIPLNSIWNFLRNILSSFIIFWYIHAFVQNDFFYLSKISSVFKNFNYRKLFSQGFQNFLEHVLLRITKLSPKLSKYRLDTLYMTNLKRWTLFGGFQMAKGFHIKCQNFSQYQRSNR